MASQGREYFCQWLASLFSPPDQELVLQVQQGALHSFFEKYLKSWEKGEGLLKGFLIEGEVEDLLNILKNEYDRLFSEISGKGISLVESFYKPWTEDLHCPLPFASERGLLMGDSALHLSAVYRQCGLEVAEEMSSMPDHLVVELEFLSYLYRWTSHREVKRFIEDHLDWVPLLKEELKRVHPHPFYASAIEVLDIFIYLEKNHLEVEDHGEKNIL
jgi:TorA maturation chaperone TorD